MALFGFAIFLAALAASVLAMRSLISPIEALDRACSRVSGGDLDADIPTRGVGEIRTMAEAARLMRGNLQTLLAQSRKSADELESKVQERTRELETSENRLTEAHIQLSALYDSLAKKERTVSRLLNETINAQEEERKRVARELHDETSQGLTALIVSLETALSDAAVRDGALETRLRDMKAVAAGVLQEVHRIMFDLRPSLLDDLGLLPAIDWYAEHRLQPLGIRTTLEVVGQETRLPSDVEITVFRVAQEAMTNIAKYSGAENVLVSLDFAEQQVVLRVEDDGKGFDVEKAMTDGEGRMSFGLLGMRERIAPFGGTLDIQSEPERGTQITATIPLGGA